MKEYTVNKETKIEMKDKKNLILESGDQIKVYSKKENKIKVNERYNGWTNWETWVVNLWMDNDGMTNYFGERIQDNLHLKVRDLAEDIKEYYDNEADNVLGRNAGLFADIINNTLNEVNWYEIAEGIIESYR